MASSNADLAEAQSLWSIVSWVEQAKSADAMQYDYPEHTLSVAVDGRATCEEEILIQLYMCGEKADYDTTNT